jgi:hypothetical protein
MGLDSILAKAVDVQALLDALEFSDGEVVFASAAQPGLHAMAARYRVQTMRASRTAALKLERIDARASKRIRDELKGSADRVTEAEVRARVVLAKAVIKQAAVLVEAQAEEEAARLLLESFRHRKDMLQVVSQMIRAEEFVMRGQSHSALDEIRKAAKDKYPGATISKGD